MLLWLLKKVVSEMPRLNLQDELWEDRRFVRLRKRGPLGSLGFGDRQEVPPMVTGRDELAVVASGGCIYAMGGSHLVWPVPCCH